MRLFAHLVGFVATRSMNFAAMQKKLLTTWIRAGIVAFVYCSAPIAQEPQMSVIERSQSFVKDMNELNVKAVTKYFEIQREAIEQFVGANRARFTALREVKGLEDVVTAQREYYAAVQKNVADSVKKQADLVRENFETSGKLVRELFNRETVSQA